MNVKERMEKKLENISQQWNFRFPLTMKLLLSFSANPFLDNSSKFFHGGNGNPFLVIILHLYFESLFNPSFSLLNFFSKRIPSNDFIYWNRNFLKLFFVSFLLTVIKLEYLNASCLWKIRKVWHILGCWICCLYWIRSHLESFFTLALAW